MKPLLLPPFFIFLSITFCSINLWSQQKSQFPTLDPQIQEAFDVLKKADVNNLPENAMCEKRSPTEALKVLGRASLDPAVKLACSQVKEFKLSGTATYYGPKEDGNFTKCGVKFWSRKENTMAVKQTDLYDSIRSPKGRFRCGDLVKVKNKNNGRIGYAIVTDTGGLPDKSGRQKTIADLSLKLAQGLGFENQGFTDVEIEICQPQVPW